MKSQTSQQESESFRVTMHGAFNGAVDKDAEMITGNGEKFYIIPCTWMANLVKYINQSAHNSSSGPGKISVAPLLQKEDDTLGSAAESLVSVSATSTSTVSAADLEGTTLNLSSSPSSVDDRSARRERWSQMKQAKEGKVRKGLVFGQDYTLVGENVWMLLSSKFGFDVSLSLNIEEGSDGDGDDIKAAVDADVNADGLDCAMGTVKRVVNVGGDTLSLPIDGRFDYSELVPDSDDAVSDDDGPAELQAESSSEGTQSLPVLLLTSSTTQPTAEISLDGMQVDQKGNASSVLHSDDDEIDNDDNLAMTKTRKRKRYGSGLGNLGNTCFMNSTLQCLAHTGPLRSYFLSGEYSSDLNRDNPLGTGGELATEFAKLLMEMWGTSSPTQEGNESSSLCNSRYSSYRKNSWNSSATSSSIVYPRSFKYTLGKHAERFVGYNQHDSQELAMYLLDALHEDTNRISKKPYIEKPEQKENESDEESAQKAWELHLKRDDSKVIENFMGQIKSKVECPKETCGRVSTTFEPVMYLSVPLPGTTETTIVVTFVSMIPGEGMKKLNVTLSKAAHVSELSRKIAMLVNDSKLSSDAVVAEDIVIAETWNKEIYKFYSGTEEVAKINDSDEIFAYQVASLEAIHQEQELEKDQDKGAEMQDEEARHIPKHRLKLDVATLSKVNKNWENVLESFLSQPATLTSLLNARRKSHDERMAFHKKLVNFLNRCYSCQECKSALQCADSDENDGKMSPTTTMASRLGATAVDDTQSLEEMCHTSTMFKNISTAQDVAALQFCCNKFHQHSINMVNEKKNEFRDGAEIQIDFRKRGVIGLSDKACGLPLILRISPTLSVYGLRKILAERLKEVINCNGSEISQHDGGKVEKNDQEMDDHPTENAGFLGESSEDLRFFCQVPLTYEKKTYSYSYSSSKSGSYRKLGSVSDSNTSTVITQSNSAFAMPRDEHEKEYVLDIVGTQGKVHVHFPTKDSFDDEKWEKKRECEKHDGISIKKSDSISVLDCIQKYCEKEQLDESEMWYCDKCEEHVPAWKHLHLYRTSPILIVHLKRFHYNSISHRRDKIDLLVDFPLKGLDLRNEVMHWKQDGSDEPIYDCYAVSNHFGGLGGGHYTAYALNDEGDWCNFDDSRVTKNIDEAEVVSSAAYMLFYRRRDVNNDNAVWIDRPMPSPTQIPSTVSSLDSAVTGRMDIEREADVTDDDTGDDIESDTMLTSSTPASSSPMIGSITDEGDDMELQ